LTTFSAFAVQSHDRGPRRGTANVLLTVPPALVACAFGFLLGS
jgi:CrcB protein